MPVASNVITQPTYTQVTPGDPGGSLIGASPAEPLGFFGATPIVQPASQGTLRGTVGIFTVYATTQTPTSVAPNTTAEQTVTVTGLATGQAVAVIKPTSQAGLAIVGVRVSATNTLAITFGNDTAATITPTTTETYLTIAAPASMVYTAALTPAAVAPNTTAEQQFTVAGLPANSAVFVNKPTAQAGLGIVNARVISAGVVGITFANFTAATITPTAAQSYLFFASPGIELAPVMQTITAALTPVSVAANTSAEQTFTVTGLAANSQVWINKPSVQPGLGIGGARVSAANTLAINFVNDTATAIVPASETYTIAYVPVAAPAAGSSTATVSRLGGAGFGSMVALGLVAGP